jgi:hypothetical protein
VPEATIRTGVISMTALAFSLFTDEISTQRIGAR